VAAVLKGRSDVPLRVAVLIPEVAASPCAARWVKVRAQGGYSPYSGALVDAQLASQAARAFE
jgi:hypothetical protein